MSVVIATAIMTSTVTMPVYAEPVEVEDGILGEEDIDGNEEKTTDESLGYVDDVNEITDESITDEASEEVTRETSDEITGDLTEVTSVFEALTAEDELVQEDIDASAVFRLTDNGTCITGLTDAGKKLTVINVPEGVKKIELEAFYNNTVVEEVTLPASLKVIGYNAFYGASNLKSINLEEVEEIGSSAFEKCTSLTEANISKVKVMSRSIFSGCTSLETVDFSGAERLNAEVFKDCSSLKNISEFNSKVMTIQAKMFQNSGLTEVKLPYTIKYINAYAFDGCSNLKDIYIYRNADENENYCDKGQSYWPSGKGVTVHCMEGSCGDKFAKELGNRIDYMALTPVENMSVFRQDGEDANNLSLKIGNASKLFIIDMGPQYCNQPVTYENSNKTVASVSSINEDEADAYGRYNFRIRPINAGNATITVKCGTFEHIINFSVEMQATSIEVKTPDTRYGGEGTEGIKLLPGDELKMETKVEPEGAIQAVTFDSLNPEIATVTNDGRIKAVSSGITSISIKTTDGSNVSRSIKVFVPYVINVNDASDIHCKKSDEGWLNFGTIGEDYKHPGIVWRYTPKKDNSEQIAFTLQGELGRSGWLAICYGDGTEAANCSSAKKKYSSTIGWYHASAYREEFNNVTMNISPKPFALYYSPGDCGKSEGFWASNLREYGKTYYISYEGNSYGTFGDNPYRFETGDVIVLNNPSRENYAFMGWYLGTEKLPVNDEGKSVLNTAGITEDITLKAKWKGSQVIPAAKLRFKDKEGAYVEYESSDSPIAIEKGTHIELTEEVYGCNIFYTTDGSEPNRDSAIYRGSITAEQDTVIKAIVCKYGQEPSTVAVWNLKIEEVDDYLGDVRIEDVNEQFAGDISRIPHGLWVAGYEKATPYTGSNITFSGLRVYDYKTLLLPVVDYTVAYKNNKNAYIYGQSDEEFLAKNAPQLIITGKNTYDTAKTIFFKITQRDISIENADNMTCVSDVVLSATGKGQKPTPSIKWNGTALKVKADFTYEYRDSDDHKITEVDKAGDYKFVITGCGNYTGTKEAPIKIVDTKSTGITLVSKLSVSSIPAQEYKAGGYSKEDIYAIFVDPANKISVKNGTKLLTIATNENDTDGQYYIKDVIASDKPGNATVVIAATNGSAYVGSKELKLVIKGIAISKANFCFIKDGKQYNKLAMPYTGDVIEPEVQLVYAISKTESKTLIEDTDYEVNYTGNVAAGDKATVVITGKGAYTGSIKKTFSITPYDVTGEESPKISVRFIGAEGVNYYSYVRPEVQPQLEVVYSYIDNNGTPQKHVLTKGTDYSVAYANNKKTGYEYSTDNKGKSIAPMATVTLKGSYKGKISSTFNIRSCNMEEINVVAADKVASNRANAWKAAVSLIDKNGQKLAANKDYDAKYIRYMYVNDTVVSLVKGGSAEREAGDMVEDSDVPPVGTYIQVEVSSGTSENYNGYTKGVYKIIAGDCDLSKATVEIKNPETNSNKYYYTGSGIRPNRADIHVYVKRGNDRVEVDPSCYIVESYKNNIKKGNASLVIKGTGEYGGTKSAAYTIVGRSLLASWFE